MSGIPSMRLPGENTGWEIGSGIGRVKACRSEGAIDHPILLK